MPINDEVQGVLDDLRSEMRVYLDLMETYDAATGDTKESLGKTIDQQLDACVALADDLMRAVHRAIVPVVEQSEEQADEHATA